MNGEGSGVREKRVPCVGRLTGVSEPDVINNRMNGSPHSASAHRANFTDRLLPRGLCLNPDPPTALSLSTMTRVIGNACSMSEGMKG